MRHKTMTVLGAACALVLLAGSAGAQGWGMSGFGAKLGYASPEDLDGTMQFGAHLEFERAGTRVHVLPSIMYWSEDDFSNVNPNVDLYYHFYSEGVVTPYVGGGLGLHFLNDKRIDQSEINVGANLFAGLRFPTSYSHYFMEGRYVASDVSQFSILGGITIHR